ncbi:glutathione S-transferase delta 3 isoform X17 [Bombyx mori]|uniref:Glutathione S-transferase 1-1-like n=1 Tax=Bombyx mori TaxID=7091 RepID=A0A8R2G8R0_BOMMO|nr:glutathione S-transferase delta 3 isoform X9 [Bombyx mori]
MVGKGSVKCSKCGITSKEDFSLTFHRFPLPSKHGSLRAKVWAKFCFPDGDWTSNESLENLNAQHRMLCGNHFDDSSFTSSNRKRLNKFAIPSEAQSILSQLREEQCSPSRASHDIQEPSMSKVNPVEMAIDLYFTAGSAPCRVVLLVAAALDLQLNLKPLNLWEREQLQADFLKLNPQHTVPTIVDEGFPLWESRAISRYLVNKYGGDSSSLYPKDLMARALVDQRLDFDIGTLYPRFAQYFYPQVFGGAKPDAAALKKLEEALVFLNAFLEGQKYVTGDVLTIADLSLVATISTIDAAEISLKSYPNVEKWFELMKTTAPDYQNANQKGIDEFKKLIAQMKAKTEL